jgi:hypothetical protein
MLIGQIAAGKLQPDASLSSARTAREKDQVFAFYFRRFVLLRDEHVGHDQGPAGGGYAKYEAQPIEYARPTRRILLLAHIVCGGGKAKRDGCEIEPQQSFSMHWSSDLSESIKPLSRHNVTSWDT